MPIFMDRHDLRGLKADDVAEAHRRDIDIQDRHGSKIHGLLNGSIENNGAAFCLVHAPDPATAESGSIVKRMVRSPTPSFRSILPPSRRFLGRISDPRAAPDAVAPAVDSGLRAVMFTDIVGSTEMTARLGDSAALELVRAHDALVRRGLEAYGGREIKHTGDGIMASSSTMLRTSVRAAADIQRRFAAYNGDASGDAQRSDRHRRWRTSVEDHNDLFGSTVQLASRLCSAKRRPTASSFPDPARELCQEEDAARSSWRSASGGLRGLCR